MGTAAPTTVVLPVPCAPKEAPGPQCGKRGRRKRTLTRMVRTVADKAVAFLEITSGAYAARGDGGTTFRNTPEGVLPKAHYDNQVRDLVLDRIRQDGRRIERTVESLRREFLLDLSSGFIDDVLRDRARQRDLAAHRRLVREHFSGTLGVDERPVGRFTRLLATDPLADLPVAFALVATHDQDHLRRFLANLKTRGLRPPVVVPDGSNLYPAVLAELGPEADHPRCVFDVIKDLTEESGANETGVQKSCLISEGFLPLCLICLASLSNTLILDAVRRLRTAMSRRGQAGRRKKRGRTTKKAKAAAGRRGPTLQEKAAFVFRHRPLVVKRRGNRTESERDDRTRMLEYLPEWATLRRCADRIDWRFDAPKDFHQASCRRAVIVRDPAFRAVPERAKAREQFAAEKLPQLMAYLNRPVRRRVRTNHQVERTNRLVRFLEKVRATWRQQRTLVRFVVLKLDAVGSHWEPPKAQKTDPPRAARHRKLRPYAGQRSGRAA